MPPAPLAVVQGTLELLILKTLDAGGEQHGFAILDFIRTATDERLVVEEGALYPALHRMERRGWLQAEWGISDNNRQVKFYRLTRGGREYLQRESSGWTEFASAVFKVLRTT